jgi:hypothetical protein
MCFVLFINFNHLKIYKIDPWERMAFIIIKHILLLIKCSVFIEIYVMDLCKWIDVCTE